jgi:hypothetical protein
MERRDLSAAKKKNAIPSRAYPHPMHLHKLRARHASPRMGHRQPALPTHGGMFRAGEVELWYDLGGPSGQRGRGVQDGFLVTCA